ncbi:lytic transglycosylase domain-containing protein [Azomonas macrocytogenes]|uniref:Transglycosylase SLT domain-containing protein n=1 Tax=Azomonas macrocytogenes TaxID=69962 RepID=A0A839T6I4_AZOMA|nr:lytic transglycosylase domain-containing protein [Azomonas macrocytogenes]MBB3105117.1 hypothetical protein [Azomonas macrocytogenes]
MRVFSPSLLATAVVAFALTTTYAFGFDLAGSVFDRAGRQAGIDPRLLYAVALGESAFGQGNGSVGPHPWTLRAPDRPVYSQSRADAEAALRALIERHGLMIDVGLMQINLHWHRRNITDPTALLDPAVNLQTGAKILAQTIASAPGDLELGIGRYHNWRDESRARNYGSRILAILRNLENLKP